MNQLQQIEFSNLRVLTTSQLAESFGTESDRISKNFHGNKSRFQQGKHFFLLTDGALDRFKNDFLNSELVHKQASSLYLWTEKGAWLHAKSLNTDQAWEAYEMLVDEYYRVKQINLLQNPQQLIALALVEAQKIIEHKDEQIAIMQPKAEFFDAVAESKTAIDFATAAKVLKIKGIGRNNLFDILRNKGILMNNNQPYQRYIDAGYFRVIEQKFSKPDSSISINIKTLVYQKGLDFIRKTVAKETA